MTPAAEALREMLRGIYSPIDRRTVTAWATDELFLSSRQTQMPGQFSTDMTPYMREPLECFGDGEVTDLVICAGSQVGKTTIIQAGVAWRVANKPAPIVWVMPNEKLAKSFSETRWMPICEDSPSVAGLIQKERHKWNKLEQHFKTCSLVFVGSNSPANLASRPAGLLLMDEIDKFRTETDKETSALLLAENRTKSFTGALRVKTSTPTTPDGEIWQEYLKGSCEKFLILCPHCKKRIELKFDQVKWAPEAKQSDGQWDMRRVYDSAYYECQECQAHISDGEKIEALQTGEWMATNAAAAPGIRSFHLPSIYAPWRSCSFASLAIKFLRDKETLSGLRDFVNSTQAEPWVDKAVELGGDDIDRRKADYELRTLPADADPIMLLVGCDVQQMFSNYVVRAWAANGESWLLDYGRLASPDDVAAFAMSATYPVRGKQRKIDGGLMDSGYMTERVYSVCVSSHKAGFRMMPCKGGQEKFLRHPVRRADFSLGSQHFPNSLVHYGDNEMKRLLYIESIKDGRGPWWIPRNVGHDYTSELMRERLVDHQTTKGYAEPFWKRTGANHYADAEKLCLVLWMAR